MKLLITAIGKRIQLIKYLKQHFEIIGVDSSNLTPALHFVDKFYKIPRYDDPSYEEAIINLCQKENIKLLLPLWQPEFQKLDTIRAKLEQVDTYLMLSDKNVLQICNDKWETYKFFKKNGITTPESFLETEEIAQFPLFIKPRTGMGSQGAFKIRDREELNFYSSRITNPIIQEFIEGIEYTIDCICDREGKPIVVIPRERLEVRSGEVSKSRTCKDSAIMEAAIQVCNKLGAVGPITIQCIRTPEGDIRFTEINPRVGGGLPLSIQAGADYGPILKAIATGEKIEPKLGQFKELTMLRYDEAVFL